MKLHIIEEPDLCRQAWETHWPVRDLFDLWPVRACFHTAFDRPLNFCLAEHDGRVKGFLPLCRNEEEGNFVQFPGETWQGKTWLEQNRLIAESPETLNALLESVPGPVHLRYLNHSPLLEGLSNAGPDETGYLFFPRLYDFSMDNFWPRFPGKTRKKLKGEVKKLEKRNLKYRFDHLPDLWEMFRMNMAAFKSESYFSDARFYRSFERLAGFLRDMGMLRITTLLAGDKIAAVDMGAVFNRTYTVLAGGAHRDFPGIAKVINLHHLEWACRKRIETVDFLCGDFNWKERFRLIPRTLFELRHTFTPNLTETCYHDPPAASA